MIGTIRRHSKWLWWVIAALTIISFIGWNIAPVSRNGGVGGSGGYGTLYGHKITAQDYASARNEFYLFYWFHNNEWPDSAVKEKDLNEQIYLRLMLTQKAGALGIYVSDESAAMAAGEMLRSLGRNGQSVPIETFVSKVLQPKGLTAEDFERFARDDVVIQQMIQTMGLAGSLVTPQEAAAAYQREHQEVSAQIVFFPASNFVSQVAITPAVISQFYSNNMSYYRLPDRVQVNYVEFNLTNYLAQSKAELARTNLDTMVETYYKQAGPDYFPDAKTPDAAKAKIRDLLIRQHALADARAQANEFATAVFNMNPPQADNLATVAKQKGLTVQLTQPFGSAYGPDSSPALQVFTKAAFALTPDDPLAGPVHGVSSDFVIALNKQLPSEVPPLDQIRDRVMQDYRTMQATMIAQRAGTNFAPTLASQLMSGHNFAAACITAGLQPESLPVFSLATRDLPELGDHVELGQFLRLVASIPAGHASPFMETEDGGFIVYVQSRTPVDQAAVSTDLPQFTVSLRHARENEAFNQWVQTEANRELRSTPAYNPQPATGTK